jgi:hypothetical protein
MIANVDSRSSCNQIICRSNAFALECWLFPVLHCLPALTSLRLSFDTNFSVDILRVIAAIQTCTHLNYLDLFCGNRFNLSSEQLATCLPRMQRLQTVRFRAGSELRHVDFVQSLRSLTSFTLRFSDGSPVQVSRVMAALQSCTMLTNMELDGANGFNFTSEQLLDSLKQMSCLQTLNLLDCSALRSLNFLPITYHRRSVGISQDVLHRRCYAVGRNASRARIAYSSPTLSLRRIEKTNAQKN